MAALKPSSSASGSGRRPPPELAAAFPGSSQVALPGLERAQDIHGFADSSEGVLEIE